VEIKRDAAVLLVMALAMALAKTGKTTFSSFLSHSVAYEILVVGWDGWEGLDGWTGISVSV
jgi:hypothetical protein